MSAPGTIATTSAEGAADMPTPVPSANGNSTGEGGQPFSEVLSMSAEDQMRAQDPPALRQIDPRTRTQAPDDPPTDPTPSGPRTRRTISTQDHVRTDRTGKQGPQVGTASVSPSAAQAAAVSNATPASPDVLTAPAATAGVSSVEPSESDAASNTASPAESAPPPAVPIPSDDAGSLPAGLTPSPAETSVPIAAAEPQTSATTVEAAGGDTAGVRLFGVSAASPPTSPVDEATSGGSDGAADHADRVPGERGDLLGVVHTPVDLGPKSGGIAVRTGTEGTVTVSTTPDAAPSVSPVTDGWSSDPATVSLDGPADSSTLLGGVSGSSRLDINGLAASISRPLSAGGGDYSVQVSLHPPELGEVRALLSLQGDALHVTLTPEHAGGFDALSEALPTLQDHLGGGGIEVHVTLGQPGHQGSDGEGLSQGSPHDGGTPGAAARMTTETVGSIDSADDPTRIHLVL